MDKFDFIGAENLGKTGFGAVLAGIFLFISFVFYIAKRPKKASPIDNVLPMENQ